MICGGSAERAKMGNSDLTDGPHRQQQPFFMCFGLEENRESTLKKILASEILKKYKGQTYRMSGHNGYLQVYSHEISFLAISQKQMAVVLQAVSQFLRGYLSMFRKFTQKTTF